RREDALQALGPRNRLDHAQSAGDDDRTHGRLLAAVPWRHPSLRRLPPFGAAAVELFRTKHDVRHEWAGVGRDAADADLCAESRIRYRRRRNRTREPRPGTRPARRDHVDYGRATHALAVVASDSSTPDGGFRTW